MSRMVAIDAVGLTYLEPKPRIFASAISMVEGNGERRSNVINSS